jgi:hypothetical protein
VERALRHGQEAGAHEDGLTGPRILARRGGMS